MNHITKALLTKVILLFIAILTLSGGLFEDRQAYAANIQLEDVYIKDAREILDVDVEFEETELGEWGVRYIVKYFRAGSHRKSAVIVTKTKKPMSTVKGKIKPINGEFILNAEDKIEFHPELSQDDAELDSQNMTVGDCQARWFFSYNCPKVENVKIKLKESKKLNGVTRLSVSLE